MSESLLESTRADLAKYRGQQDRGEGVYEIVRALQERVNALELIVHFTTLREPHTAGDPLHGALSVSHQRTAQQRLDDLGLVGASVHLQASPGEARPQPTGPYCGQEFDSASIQVD